MTTASMPLAVYSLELHAVAHCNLACEGCAQSSPKLARGFEDTQVLARALGNLSGVLRCQKLQILGGEPLLHPDLIDILQLASSSGLASALCLKTNGLLLGRMPERFWTLVDQVIVSAYPATAAALQRARPGLETRAAAHGVSLTYRSFPTFRHITKEHATANARLVAHIFAACEYKRFTHSLRDGRLYRCAPSVNMTEANALLVEEEGLDLLNTQGLAGRLRAFLTSDAPLAACRFCLGSSGAEYPHVLSADRMTSRP